MSNSAQTKEGVRFAPSETALSTAMLRALAAHDPRQEVRGGDILAELFLTDEQRATLRDGRIRDWVMKNRITPGAYEFMIARTAFFDEIVRKALLENIPQFVLLGAGYDTRPYRFAHFLGKTSVFELDAFPTQCQKRGLLEKSGFPIPVNVTFTPIDFTSDDVEQTLLESGYDREKAALFLWEGVSYYLSREAVDRTLAAVRSLSAPGSCIAFDVALLSPEGLHEENFARLREQMKSNHPAEPAHFGIPQGFLDEFLAGRGFRVKEHIRPDQMELRYLTLLDGTRIGHVPTVFNLIVAQRA
jgi:methyltransferase (TIGR00027 family)